MKTKIITYFILFWFAFQAVFMFYWPLYLYCQNGIKFYEMLALGCIILPSSIFIIVNNDIIKKNSDLLIVGLFYCFCSYWHIRQFGRQSKTNARIGVNIYHDYEYSFVNSQSILRVKSKPTLNNYDKRL